jgi:hypothetical protein
VHRPAIEPRKVLNPEADVLDNTEGNMSGCDSASTRRSGVVKDPGMCGSSLYGNREVSGSAGGGRRRSASGRRGAVADDARTREDPMGEWIATSAFRESEAD